MVGNVAIYDRTDTWKYACTHGTRLIKVWMKQIDWLGQYDIEFL